MRKANVLWNLIVWFSLCGFLPSIIADTPANCTYEDARGSWIFNVAPQTDAKNCNSKKATTLVIQLIYPDISKDQFGNFGFWTLIYNQGFEVVIGGRKYFGYFKYAEINKRVVSYCDQLLPGWSHDILVRKWACTTARKNSTVPPKIHLASELIGGHERLVNNPDFIKTINIRQKSWTAAQYPVFLKKTREEILLMSGGPKSRILSPPKPAPVSEALLARVSALPRNFDWRNVSGRNYLTPVRNQGSCGSCYSFSSMGMLEARLRVLRNNTMTEIFSEQDVVDCSPYSQGCGGGFPYLVAGKYAEDIGIVPETCNPYTGIQHKVCTTKYSCSPRFYASNYRYVGGYYGACNEALMRDALVRNGPLSVSFEVYNDFIHYRGGIYHRTGRSDGFNPFQLTNHAVLLVGYGEDPTSNEPFWIVKNSWGAEWGEKGYFRIRRGTDECAIESLAVESFPIL